MSNEINDDDDAITPQGDAAASSGGVTVGGNVGGNIIVGDHNTIVNQYPAPESFLHQLPAPPHDFTGRKTELDELTKAVDRGVTISGVQGQGGVGKTALALQLAQKLLPLYPAAQFFLDLRGVSDSPLTPAEAMAHVIRAYRPNERLPDDDGQLKAIYQSVLHDQKALLLMDNAKDKDQVLPLIPPHTCCLIVTSRQHFALPGLYTQNLEVMSSDDARDLLTIIAPHLTRHDSRITNELASLCAYLPLALRAAASTLAEEIDLDPADYAKQLRDEKTRLGLKGVTATTGEISVEASLNLSYRQLSDEAKRVFRCLSVFPADFDAQAEDMICEDGKHKQLSELVKRSLVNYNREKKRYWLHDLIRIYSKSLLSVEQKNAITLRHVDYYLKLFIADEDAAFRTDAINLSEASAWLSGLEEKMDLTNEGHRDVQWAIKMFQASLRIRFDDTPENPQETEQA